jgi:hypothetical protein
MEINVAFDIYTNAAAGICEVVVTNGQVHKRAAA